MWKREHQTYHKSQLIRKALDVKLNNTDCGMFYLVESYKGPSDGQKFKQVLADDETFETDFIGASAQDCRKWAVEKQYQNKMIEKDIIAIADEQSTRDDTLSIQFYSRGPGIELEGHGILPQAQKKWYDFRVIYKEADTVYIALLFGAPDIVYPVYFERKDELTDERGIFNIARARELCIGGTT